MRDATIVRIALSVALVGLLGLVIIARFTPPAMFSPNTNQLDREVKIKGRVVRVGDGSNTLFIQLEHTVRTDVVVFKPREFELNVGDEVEVTGNLEEYKGKQQLVAYRIS